MLLYAVWDAFEFGEEFFFPPLPFLFAKRLEFILNAIPLPFENNPAYGIDFFQMIVNSTRCCKAWLNRDVRSAATRLSNNINESLRCCLIMIEL